MAVEDQIVTVLRANAGVSALVGSRIYAMPAPQGTSSPFITYQIIAAARSGMSYHATAVHDVVSLQVDCWSDDTASTSSNSRAEQVNDLARAVRAALDGTGLTGEDIVDLITWTGWSDFSTPTETRRALDFTLMVRN